MESRIEPMRAADAAGVLAVYREGIGTGDATFETAAPSWEEWDRSHLDHCRLVARDGDRVVGWAALSPITDRCAYRGVAEVSVYVAGAAMGPETIDDSIAQGQAAAIAAIGLATASAAAE